MKENVSERDRCELIWSGKSQCIQEIQTPVQSEMIPQPSDSFNFDTTHNYLLFFNLCDSVTSIKLKNFDKMSNTILSLKLLIE